MMGPIVSLVNDKPHLVSELIDSSSAIWREDKVRTVFLPADADIILRIPLCTRHVRDFWAWGEDDKGVFSVASVYRFLLKTKLQREALLEQVGGRSNIMVEEKAWTSLWSLRVPSKLKIFLWRLCHESLPTSDVLQHRDMTTTRICTLCSAPDT